MKKVIMAMAFLIVFLLIVLLIVCLIVFSSGLRIEDFQVAGFKLYDTQSIIIKKLGKPLKTERNYSYSDSYTDNCIYPGLDIEFWGEGKNKLLGRAGQITINNSRYKTFRGLKVGDSKEILYKKYGKTNWKSDSELIYYKAMPTFENPGLHYLIYFEISDGKVSKITYRYETN